MLNRHMLNRSRSPLWRYGAAALSVALALLLTLAIGPLREQHSWTLFMAAVMVGAWYGGLWPGLLATLLAMLASTYFLLSPVHSFHVMAFSDIVGLVVFTGSALAINSLNAARHQAEEEIRKQREWLHTTLSSIGDAVIATDIQGRVTFINPNAESLTGWKLEHLIGEPLEKAFRLLNEETRKPVENPVAKVIQEGRAAGLANHTILIARDGTEIPIDDSAAPIKDATGNITGVVMVFRDIIERRRGEAALRDSEVKFRSLAETAPCAIFIHQGANYLYVNPAAESLTGYTQAELLTMNFWELVYPDSRAQVQQRGLARQQGGAVPPAYEFKILTKAGQERWVDLVSTVITFEGKPAVLGTAYDITERKRGEEALARLAAIVESSDDAIFSRTADGIIVSWNAGAERIFGYSAGEIEGQSSAVLLPPDRPDEAQQMIGRILHGEHVDHYETVRVRKDGKPIHVSLTMSPIKDSTGRITAISTIARDITERKRAEQERARLLASAQAARTIAEAANRAKDEFLATVTHELRTPLVALLGWARLLRTGQLDEAAIPRALETIERCAQTQGQLIEDLLDTSAIMTGKLCLDIGQVDLVSVIKAAIDTVRLAAETKGIRIQKSLDPEANLVAGDPSRLQQVVWNLLWNAVKFTPKGGRVEVRLVRIDTQVEITVADTGQGIRADFLPHVFDRFRQADASSTRRSGGLGLGLAIVRHLVELHGGTIRAESAGEGQGATFTVRLPIASAAVEKIQWEHACAPVQGEAPFETLTRLDGLRVLVVDDEADAREFIRHVLTQCGAKVLAVASASEALAAIRLRPPDVLVSDIRMPEEDGYTLIRKVRALEAEIGRRIPAIALTAYARIEDRMTVLSEGYQMHVLKPIQPAALVATVASLAGRTESG